MGTSRRNYIRQLLCEEAQRMHLRGAGVTAIQIWMDELTNEAVEPVLRVEKFVRESEEGEK